MALYLNPSKNPLRYCVLEKRKLTISKNVGLKLNFLHFVEREVANKKAQNNLRRYANFKLIIEG